MSGRIGANGAGVRLVDIQGRPIAICPTCGAPIKSQVKVATYKAPAELRARAADAIQRKFGSQGSGIKRL